MTTDNKICSQCKKEYSLKQKTRIINKCLSSVHINPANTFNLCLDCLIENIQKEAAKKIPSLTKAIFRYTRFSQITKKACQKKEKLEQQYALADRQQSYLLFFIKQEKQQREKQSHKQQIGTKQKTKKIAPNSLIKLLNELSPEQRKDILNKYKN